MRTVSGQQAELSVAVPTFDFMIDPTDHEILTIESAHWRYAGAKDAAITDRTGLSPIAYYQRLNQLLDTEAAALANPALINRLRRVRQQRSASRRRRAM